MEDLKKVKCPECQALIKIDEDIEEGDITFCPECDVELEISSLDPPTVALAGGGSMDDFEDESDFEDDEYDDADFEDDF